MERTKAQSPAASTSSSGHAARDEAVAAKLLDSNVELSTKHKIIVDLRDNVEHLSREQQSSFTRHILPALMTVLKTGKVSFMIHSTEYKYRHALLSTLLRLSSIEVFRPHAVEMASLCIQLMRDDAEANAVLAVKILVDLFRTHKELLQPKAPDVIQAILDVYAAMPSVVSELFDKETASSPGSHAQTQQATQSSDVPTPPSQPSTQNSSQGQQPVPPGQRSFTILWEVPIAVVFLFQSYKDLVQSHAKFCIPRCFEFLQLHPQAQDAAHQAAEAAGEIQVGPCAALESKRQLFSDYVSAQVKTVSFVAYVLRSGAMGELTAEQRTALPQIIVRVFKDLPVETSQHRKVSALLYTVALLCSHEGRVRTCSSLPATSFRQMCNPPFCHMWRSLWMTAFSLVKASRPTNLCTRLA